MSTPSTAISDAAPDLCDADAVARWHRVLRGTRRKARDAAFAMLGEWVTPRALAPPALGSLRSVLLVQMNHRLGNSVIAAAAVPALVAAMPQATIDFAGSPVARELLDGFPIRRSFLVPRFRAASPADAARLVRAVRRERYEAAIHLGLSGRSSGALVTGVSGATHRIGCNGRHSNALFTHTVEPPRARHRVDAILEYAARLGAAGEGGRPLRLSEAETRWAHEFLDCRSGSRDAAPIGIFVGGRRVKSKDWPLDAFARVTAALRAARRPVLAFLGPEERARRREIHAAIGEATYVEQVPLRRVAALLSRCDAVLSPDSGPMHLAVAAGVPTIGLFRASDPARWGPRRSEGESIVDPDGTQWERVVAALLRPPPGNVRLGDGLGR